LHGGGGIRKGLEEGLGGELQSFSMKKRVIQIEKSEKEKYWGLGREKGTKHL